ncbi:uncharacterized protein LOC143291989 isoform X2 [Babylonia areolata]|uniref:uncharacterized protein LOC143291989 isoform X2 n=1 Tax=Babylonia areolata TaxID=304850 RepID=UPI003FD00C57
MEFLTYLLVLLCFAGSVGQAVPSSSQQHTVELMFVLDKRAFDTWYQKTEVGGSEQTRHRATVTRVVDFLSSVVVGMNNLYESASAYGLRLDVRLKKVHILQEDIWESKELRPGSKDQISSMHGLDLFYAWLWRHRFSLERSDHAMLVTGYNAIDPNFPDKPTQGVAYKSAVCKYGSVSMIENTFTYQMIDTAAHELGHSLGCDHDGENNECDHRLGHLMSASTVINSTHRWSFSPCSVRAIQRNIAELNRLHANCLVHTTTDPTPGVELGTLLTADDQCRLLSGPDAFFCRDFYDTAQSYSKLCVSMWCSASKKSPQCQNHIASDGFVCGYNKMCKRGQCIPAAVPSSTPALDTCPQGERPGEVHQGLTCPELVARSPWLCYVPAFRRECCLSCHSVSHNVSGCEYGDKQEWCSTKMKYPYDCYANEKTCCKSCLPYKDNDNPGCEYGDHSAECQTKLIVPLGCYQNEAACCETCSKVKSRSNPSCPYGDKSTWCKEKLIVPEGCSLNSDLCCGTCANVTIPSTTTPTTTTTTPTTTSTTPTTTSTTPTTTSTTTTPTTTTTTTSTSSTLPPATTQQSQPSPQLSTEVTVSTAREPPVSTSSSSPQQPETTTPSEMAIQTSTEKQTQAGTTAYTKTDPTTSTKQQQTTTLTTRTTPTTMTMTTPPQPPTPTTTTTTTTSTTQQPSTTSATTAEVMTTTPQGDALSGCGVGDLDLDRDPEQCQKETPHGCYNATVLQSCCASCAEYRTVQPGCEYGDMFKNCEDLLYPYACYLPANAQACCATYCPYGDHHAWCHRLSQRYANDEWCSLDKEDGHCCGTCLYNETAVPTLGSDIKTAKLSTKK